MKTLLSTCSLLIAVVASVSGQPRWPEVKQQDFVFHFVQGKAESFSAHVVSATGTPVYRFDCAGGDGEKQLPTLGDVYAGDVECHLLPLKQPEGIYYKSLLLSPEDYNVSSGRAVFFAYMLRGKCSVYPDWGLVREFRVRGMRIKLSLSDVVFQPYAKENRYTGIKSATLRIRVHPDRTATSELAEPSRYLEPRVLNPEEGDENKYRVGCTHVRSRK